MNTTQYSWFVSDHFVKRNTGVDGMVHATLGLATEAGEFGDAVKKHWVYGKPLDRDNLIEELGDIEWYAEAARSLMGVSREQVSGRRSLLISEVRRQVISDSRAPLIMIAAGLNAMSSSALTVAIADMHVGHAEIGSYNAIIDSLAQIDEFIELAAAHIEATREEIIVANVVKLSKRYPSGKYTDADAIARADKDAQQQYAKDATDLQRERYVL